VVERGPDYFVLRYEVGLETTPEDIYRAVNEVGRWWDGAHTYTGEAMNLTLPLEVGACFCEAMPDGTAFEHGRVVEADPQTGVLLDAPLGPLKGKADTARWAVGWSPANGGWTLVMAFVVRGEGLGALADPVDSVMGGQFRRLSHYVVYGEPPADAPTA